MACPASYRLDGLQDNLSEDNLPRVHRYSSAGCSLLEPLMQRYWEWLVARVPAWIAPNLITVIGLATNIVTTLVLVYYCPTATEQVRTPSGCGSFLNYEHHYKMAD